MPAALRGIYVIWLREVRGFFRERSRLVGMFAQPLLYLFLVGTGIARTMRFAVTPGGAQPDYMQFMYPGIMGMSLLFTSIFSASSIIWDREFGFLKEVLVAPVPRWSVAVGKAVGIGTVVLIQAAILLVLAPLIGVRLSLAAVAQVLGLAFLMSLALGSFGLAVAARTESMQGFHMIMNFLIMPMYFLSGAMFPAYNLPAWLDTLMRLDPLTYGVDALRHALYAGTPLAALTRFNLALDVAVVAALAVALGTAGAVSFSTQE